MGRNNLSKRRNKVSKRKNKISKRRNKVSKRRNKVSKRKNKISKRRSKVYNRQSRLFKYGGVGPGEPRTAPEAVQKRVNFGKVLGVGDGDSHDLYECPPPKQYSNLKDMPGKLKRSEIYKMALGKRMGVNRRTFEVKEKLCGSETPYLTDNGYCCSPTVE